MTVRTCLAGLALIAVAAGCGKPVLRVADASLGDYYTPQEYRKLSDEQRQEYCRELAEQRDLFREQIEGAEEALDGLRATTGPLQAEVDSLAARADELERHLAEAHAAEPERPAPAPSRGDRYVVRAGESLWTISAKAEVYGEAARWNRLYRANRDRIHDPDRIYPGQEIQIPR